MNYVYSYNLDIIRIRREGFPIHYELSSFVSRYKCLVIKGRAELVKMSTINNNDMKLLKDTCSKILTKTIKVPVSDDWQIGKTRIFMRGNIHEPLEEKRSQVINDSATRIQSRFKGFTEKREFLRKKGAAKIIQQHFRNHRQKIEFLRIKRAVITIQAFVRGMFAREVAAGMRKAKKVQEEMKRREEEEKRRVLELELEERRMKEEELVRMRMEEERRKSEELNPLNGQSLIGQQSLVNQRGMQRSSIGSIASTINSIGTINNSVNNSLRTSQNSLMSSADTEQSSPRAGSGQLGHHTDSLSSIASSSNASTADDVVHR